ncbi:hypothetical protein [Aeromicrobium fastidiosum]|uniref:Uncharacterized protein n=1 Tax=Aeromicrobium fastidiosum TaxID=52699 RepID=A0A641AIT2_9ACTN|nr:hypothetical protein [Aeromicrobium fastidiosum]KAA1373568.1 hypothetical protein ESP62_016510 [Aeromicrobium fastidiosum]MBP2391112.1 hypothetical protein [Aeromicrobium fastidiosum]
MNTTLDTTLMPAQHVHTPSIHDVNPTHGSHGEEVKAVALFESRRGRVTRAWDELSEIDRAVLLESVRQRRKLQRRKQEIYAQVYNRAR